VKLGVAEQYDTKKEKDKPKSNNDPNESSGEDDSEELEDRSWVGRGRMKIDFVK
jgi:hypothetical protein